MEGCLTASVVYELPDQGEIAVEERCWNSEEGSNDYGKVNDLNDLSKFAIKEMGRSCGEGDERGARRDKQLV